MKKLLTILLVSVVVSSPVLADDGKGCISDWHKFDFLKEKQELYFYDDNIDDINHLYNDLFSTRDLSTYTTDPLIYYSSGKKQAYTYSCRDKKCDVDDFFDGLNACDSEYQIQVGSCMIYAVSYKENFYCLLKYRPE